MSTVLRQLAEFPESKAGIALIIGRGTECGLHTGFAYLTESGTAKILHLAWHYKLENLNIDEVEGDFRWSQASGIPSLRHDEVAVRCELVFDVNGPKNIPYGLFFDDAVKFQDSGFLFYGSATGLTCSTFVLALLGSIGIRLLELDDWKERKEEDKQWLNCIRQVVKNSELMDKLEGELGCLRFKPSEVFSASTCPHIPVGFDEAKAMGYTLEEQL